MLILHAWLTVSGMKISQLTRKQINSVRCPTCRVAAGKPCVLSAGGLRVEPHATRKSLASEAMERNELRSVLLSKFERIKKRPGHPKTAGPFQFIRVN